MFKPFARSTAQVVKRIDRTGQIFKSLMDIAKQDVLIGIPQQTTSRPDEGEPINNAELAFIHSEGAPMHNIPPRPFLQPSIEENMAQIKKGQAQVFKDALEGKSDQAHQDMERLGLMGSTLAKEWFTDPRNDWPPNSPATIKRKGSDKPLIDTGQLRNAITYVVRDKAND